MISWINTPVVITTRKIPRIKTRWKWLEKLVGYKSYDVQDVGNVLFLNGKAYMTETDYEYLKDIIPSSEEVIYASK